jgi:hypothetical protein
MFDIEVLRRDRRENTGIAIAAAESYAAAF